ncbi:MAG: beta-galactosidase [Candidatus Omnitrophica bacterium]|nr:beta-galactosidase [Candidatus Omnitrophota bacterium]
MLMLICSNTGFKNDNKMANAGIIKDNQDNPFGVLEFLHWNHDWNNYKYASDADLFKAVSLMKEAGIGWVRMDFLWEDIEPQPDKFDFEKYDKIVDLLIKNNIKILGLLNYCASWASICGKWNSPPEHNELFVKYACLVVKRYKDQIKYWEIWNEPDSHIYWQPQDGLKSYCLLLKDVYLALKKVDPECKILNGGFAKGASSVNNLYDNKAKDYFDILNLHIFESPLNPGAVKRISAYPKLVYKIMKRNGDGNKKIWVTEIGSPGVNRGSRVASWWMGSNPSLRQQAQWVKDVYTELLRLGYVEKVFWAFFRDCKEHWKNGTDYLGLVRWDFSRKPAFSAYRGIVSKMELTDRKGE